MARVEYKAYGKWHVTTEGDCKGQTTKDLGVFEGYIDEIAFALGRKAYYGLQFETAKKLPVAVAEPPVNSVNVSLNIDSGTWDLTAEQRVSYFQNLLKGRKVVIEPSSYYASVILVADPEKEKQRAKEKALAKLTDQEKELLGLK